MSLVCRHIISKINLSQCRSAFINSENVRRVGIVGSITSKKVYLITTRAYCDGASNQNEVRALPPLMKFPEITWPSIVQSIRNWIFATFIIRPNLDNDFNVPDFIEGSKHAVEVVSNALKDGDFNSLEGLVKPETITELKASVGQMSMTQREQLAVEKDDIYFQFPYQIGVIFEESDKRWVEITMCYHVLKGFRRMNEENDPAIALGFQHEYQDKMFICNYRFIREFTKGVEDSWTVNVINHFKPALK